MHMIDGVRVSTHSSERTVKQVAHASRRIESHIQDVQSAVELLSQNTLEQNELFLIMQKEVEEMIVSFEKNKELESMVKEIQEKTNEETTSYNATKLTKEVLESIDSLEGVVSEAGVGFTIVSNEMKELSDHTQQATERIGHLIGDIQSKVLDTSTYMEMIKIR